MDGAAAPQLRLGRKLICRLLIRALGLLNLRIGDGKLGLCQCEFGIGLDNTAPSGLGRSFLLRRIQLEQRLPGFHPLAEPHIDLLNASVTFRKNWDSPVQGDDA